MESDEGEDENLGYDDAGDHGHGIYGGVADGGVVAGESVVGVAQRHGVSHRAAEHAASGTEVKMTGAHRHGSYNENGDDGDEEALTYPYQSVGTHDGVEESCSGVESETGEEERQTDAAEHEVGGTGGVRDEVEFRSEATDEDADNHGTSGKTHADGRRESGQGNGNGAEEYAQYDSDEDDGEVRVLELRVGVAEDFCYVVDSFLLADDRQPVAELQHEVGRGKELYAGARHTGNVDAVAIAEPERAEFLSVDFGARDYEVTRDERGVDGVPVDIVLVPVLLLLSAENHAQFGLLLVGGDCKQTVAFGEDGVGVGYCDLAVVP